MIYMVNCIVKVFKTNVVNLGERLVHTLAQVNAELTLQNETKVQQIVF